MSDEILRSRHGFGALEKVQEVIDAGKLDAFDVLFVKDKNGKPYVGWIDRDGNPVILEDKKQILPVSELPSIGDPEVIYIFESKFYFWDGEKYVSPECDGVDESTVNSKVAEAVNSANAYTDGKIEAAINEHMAKKYEISSVPVGTLVDYSENEIRIMCPTDAVFTKQAVGTGGDPNCYYVTFKTYVLDDNITGYIEHLGDKVDSEILTTFSTDEYGRRYQPTWLAVARYDEATGVWSYYGANSSKEKYIGWDYQIDWYNAEGRMIASDSVRINLSNEDCHFINKPYYLTNVMTDVDTKIEEKITELEAAYTVIEF